LTPAGRLRLIQRCQSRPIAHVAAEAGVSRQCLSKWKSRYDSLGEVGLLDRSSAPHASPTQLPGELITRIEALRRGRKLPARLISVELQGEGVPVSQATVSRWLVRLGINRRRDLDPKKVGRIPEGGGWRVHGRGSDQHRTSDRAKAAGARAGYVFLHSAVDGYSRLAYTEPLPDEKAATAIGFFARARAFFAAHGITRLTRVITDNGSCYRAAAFTRSMFDVARHQRTRPFTPRHNGKVERYQRILAEELLYAHTFTSEADRSSALAKWLVHYNYHRPHTTAGNQPPATRLTTGVTNVMSSYS
jgi:transposase InsO family protein